MDGAVHSLMSIHYGKNFLPIGHYFIILIKGWKLLQHLLYISTYISQLNFFLLGNQGRTHTSNIHEKTGIADELSKSNWSSTSFCPRCNRGGTICNMAFVKLGLKLTLPLRDIWMCKSKTIYLKSILSEMSVKRSPN